MFTDDDFVEIFRVQAFSKDPFFKVLVLLEV